MLLLSQPPNFGIQQPYFNETFDSNVIQQWNQQGGLGWSVSSGLLNVPNIDNARIFKAVEPQSIKDVTVSCIYPALPNGAVNQGYGPALWTGKDFNFSSSIACYCRPGSYFIRINNSDYASGNFPTTPSAPYKIDIVKTQTEASFYVNGILFYTLSAANFPSQDVYGFGMYSNGAASGTCDSISASYTPSSLDGMLYLDEAFGSYRALENGPWVKYMAFTGDSFYYAGANPNYIVRSGSGGNDANDSQDAYMFHTPSKNIDQYGRIDYNNLSSTFPGPGIVLRKASGNNPGLMAQFCTGAWRLVQATPGVASRTFVANSNSVTIPSSGYMEFVIKANNQFAIKINGTVLPGSASGTLTTPGTLGTGLELGFCMGSGGNRVTRVELGNNLGVAA